MSKETEPTCFVCGCSNDTPLISIVYKGQQAWICPADMPRLIHQTDTLSEELDRMLG